MTEIVNLSDIDFETYKANLKNYLKNQTQFKDYDFIGSNMSVLLDLLAYNTFHNNFYNNMVISEMFLDTSQLRSSVTSHAKSLNYMPRSKRAAAASITVTLAVNDNYPFVLIPAKTLFTSPSVNGSNYKFYTLDSVAVIPENGKYVSEPISIYEGIFSEEKFFISSNKAKTYPIGNVDIDTTTLKVFITNADGVEEEYKVADSLYGLETTSKIFYLQLTTDTYEIYFGRDVFGKQPVANSIMRIEYITTNGPSANGICEFFSPSTISGYNVARILPIGIANGGAVAESNDSIKLNATKSYQIQDRAVTERDYENILKNQFPEIQSISVVGGEELNPPMFGNVYAYVDVKLLDGISENTKDKIKDYIKPRMPIGININIESPNFLYLSLNSTVSYSKNVTNKSPADIRKLVFNNVRSYSDNTLSVFGSNYYHSLLENLINETEASIISNITNTRVYAEKELQLAVRNDFTINFGVELNPITDYAYRAFASENPTIATLPTLISNTSIRPPTVSTSNFVYNGVSAYIRDNGSGILQVVRQSGNTEIVLNKNVGSVNYKTGVIRINKLIVQSYNGSGVKFYIVPMNRDFTIPKTTILSLRPEDLIITAVPK